MRRDGSAEVVCLPALSSGGRLRFGNGVRRAGAVARIANSSISRHKLASSDRSAWPHNHHNSFKTNQFGRFSSGLKPLGTPFAPGRTVSLARRRGDRDRHARRQSARCDLTDSRGLLLEAGQGRTTLRGWSSQDNRISPDGPGCPCYSEVETSAGRLIVPTGRGRGRSRSEWRAGQGRGNDLPSRRTAPNRDTHTRGGPSRRPGGYDHAKSQGIARLAALALLVLGTASPAGASYCGAASYRVCGTPVVQTVDVVAMAPRYETVMQTVYETVYEVQPTTVMQTRYRTAYRTEQYQVRRPVVETRRAGATLHRHRGRSTRPPSASDATPSCGRSTRPNAASDATA